MLLRGQAGLGFQSGPWYVSSKAALQRCLLIFGETLPSGTELKIFPPGLMLTGWLNDHNCLWRKAIMDVIPLVRSTRDRRQYDSSPLGAGRRRTPDPRKHPIPVAEMPISFWGFAKNYWKKTFGPD